MMAWSWSHTQDAYRDAELNLRALDRSTLEEIFAEWHSRLVRVENYSETFSAAKYNKGMALARKLDTSELADYIWEKASEQQTCDNGGFNAWLCPYGCGPHCVPFDRN